MVSRSVSCLLLCCALLLLMTLLYSDLVRVPVEQTWTAEVQKLAIAPQRAGSDFVPVLGKGVISFNDVCIEHSSHVDRDNMTFIARNTSYSTTSKIVIYNSGFNREYNNFLVGASRNIRQERAYWSLTFKQQAVPQSHKKVDRVAFFIIATCPGNLHHFWEDEMVQLYSVVQRARRLEPGIVNQVIYRYPWHLAPKAEAGCYDIRTYQRLLLTLNLHPEHDWYGHIATNTCFSHGVFGLANLLGKTESPRLAVEHVLNRMGINRSSCLHQTMTLVQRSKRRILNMDSLAAILQNHGYHDVKVAQFETMTLQDQLRTAACSRIMIGVQGAGLQWSMFMAPGSVLVEIAWPKTYWPFYYHKVAKAYDLGYAPMEAVIVQPNWAVYEEMLLGGQAIGEAEKMHLIHSKPLSLSQDNIWKWADITVDAETLIDVLEGAQV